MGAAGVRGTSSPSLRMAAREAMAATAAVEPIWSNCTQTGVLGAFHKGRDREVVADHLRPQIRLIKAQADEVAFRSILWRSQSRERHRRRSPAALATARVACVPIEAALLDDGALNSIRNRLCRRHRFGAKSIRLADAPTSGSDIHPPHRAVTGCSEPNERLPSGHSVRIESMTNARCRPLLSRQQAPALLMRMNSSRCRGEPASMPMPIRLFLIIHAIGRAYLARIGLCRDCRNIVGTAGDQPATFLYAWTGFVSGRTDHHADEMTCNRA